jgi:hypothetical protein
VRVEVMYVCSVQGEQGQGLVGDRGCG